jgi:paraquat-inducible protein B
VSAPTHPRAVGAFVLGAITLVLAAITFLSSGSLFQQRDRFTVFFPGSVKGLNPGAAVTFRGVKVGEVREVTAVYTGKEDPLIQIEVVIELYGNVVQAPRGVERPPVAQSPEETAAELIRRGVRGRMMSASLLTGQRYIDFDFLPDEPARMAGLNPRYPELPTTPTAMEKLGAQAEAFLNKLAELPLAEMLEDVRKVITKVREIVESPDVKEVFASANRTAKAIEPVMTEARRALEDAQKLMRTLDSEVGQTTAEARRTLENARAMLSRAEQSVATLDETLQGADDARQSATRTLEDLSRALQALQNLVDYIQTHPEALLQGKERAQEK